MLRRLLGRRGREPHTVTLRVFRHTPGAGAQGARYAEYAVDTRRCGPMLVDALDYVKARLDPSLAYRRSCREGVCGSCAVNINGANGLACMQRIADHGPVITVRPLPHFKVVRDLVVDMDYFFDCHAAVKPWLRSPRQQYAPPPPQPQKQQQQQKEVSDKKGEKEKEGCEARRIIKEAAQRAQQQQKQQERPRELYQSPEERRKLDGLYECVLCGCCSGACPEYWWGDSGHQKFLGPAALLQAHRWLADSRDGAKKERLQELRSDPHRAFKCHAILNCNAACPKDLNPARSVDTVRKMLLDE